MSRLLVGSFIVLVLVAASAARADKFDDDYAAARKLLDAHKLKEAGAIYIPLKARLKEALAKTPDDARLNYLYGRVCMDGAEDEDAAAALDKAIKIEPMNADYLTTRAELLRDQGKYAEAVGYLKRAAGATPTKAEAWALLAAVQIDAKQFADARESIGKARGIEPKNAHHVGMLGEVLVAEGKPDEAIKTYEQALAMDPNYTMAFMNIGQLHQTAGRYAESLAAYEKGLKLAPEDWRAWSKVVQLYQSMGKTAERDAAREKILALWKAHKVDQPLYCREQFKQGDSNVMVFEYFELKGEQAVRYSFNVLTAEGKLVKKVSLGSYEMTTQIAREQGSIGKDERMFHLDEYEPRKHATLGMFKKEPTYEETRKMVCDYLDGKLKPAASTTYPPKENKGE